MYWFLLALNSKLFAPSVEGFPEFELAPFTDLTIGLLDAEVVADDVEQHIQTLLEQQKEWVAVDRVVQQGDQVLIDYTGK